MKSEITKQRIDRILNADKEEMNQETRAAALADFLRVAQEYFETDGIPAFQVHKTKNGLDVSLNFHAVRVKNFTLLK